MRYLCLIYHDAHGARHDAHGARHDAHGAKHDAHGAKHDAHDAKHGGHDVHDETALDASRADEYETLVGEAAACDEGLRASGHVVVAERLQPAAAATTVRSWHGRVATACARAPATGEDLDGFVLIEARDLNEAIQVAARLPPGRSGRVEVRPVRERGRFGDAARGRSGAR